nr:MAG TPA: hypothetical protein [Caudoviricetes sp.]
MCSICIFILIFALCNFGCFDLRWVKWQKFA